MSERSEAAATGEKARNGKPPHVNERPKEMVAFYEALGFFNATIVARVIHDPDKARDIIKDLYAFCPVHDAMCDSGFQYDHARNVCIPKQPELD